MFKSIKKKIINTILKKDNLYIYKLIIKYEFHVLLKHLFSKSQYLIDCFYKQNLEKRGIGKKIFYFNLRIA